MITYPSPSPSKVWTARELAAVENTTPDWLIRGLWTHGSKIACVGDSRSYKSWVMADVVLHLAAGERWLGFDVSKVRRVAYVDEEMNLKLAARRLQRLCKGSNLDLRELPLRLLSQQAVRMVQGGPEKLLKDLGDFDPEVIVIDTLLQVIEGDVNTNRDVAVYYNRLKPLIHGGSRTVYTTHHLTKEHPDPRMRRNEDVRTLGGGYIVGGSDEHFSLSRKITPRGLDSRSTMKFWKNREGVEGQPIHLTVEDMGPCGDYRCDVTGQTTIHFCPARIVRVEERAASHPTPLDPESIRDVLTRPLDDDAPSTS